MGKSLPGDDAFTLTELLVVIAIIAVLAAIAVPSLQAMMARGRDARCASNLKALGAGVHAFCADNNGLFPNPRPTSGKTEEYWHRQISTYLGATNFDAFTGRPKMDNVFLCPSDANPYYDKISYGMNSNLFRKRIAQATRPSAMMSADSSNPSLIPQREKTNHGIHVHFLRVDGSFAKATNLGTPVSAPEIWLISR
jgi:prepilin-type N-terminal cleavage/methylation domain-containing protein